MASSKNLTFGVLIMILSIALSIVMMALNAWVSSCDPGDFFSGVNPSLKVCHVGLRSMTYDATGDGTHVQALTLPNGCEDQNLQQDVANYCTRWFDGGTIILASGIISYCVFVFALILLIVAHRRMVSNYRYFGLFGLYASSSLMVLGIVLYADKQFAGYSFILMVLAAFMYFIGVGLVAVGGWDIKTKTGAGGSKAQAVDKSPFLERQH